MELSGGIVVNDILSEFLRGFVLAIGDSYLIDLASRRLGLVVLIYTDRLTDRCCRCADARLHICLYSYANADVHITIWRLESYPGQASLKQMRK
jgi:hypothetical protein